MKKNFFFFIFFFLKISFVSAENNITYIDLNFILNNSIVGKSLKEHMLSINNQNLNELNKIEEILKKKESELISQKNIISKDDFEKKILNLSNEINDFNIKKKNINDKFNEIKIKNTKKVLEILNPIIKKYVEKNEISIVLPKKNIIVGRKNLDITNVIIQILDEEIKKIEFLK
tara:strand:- start:611 stop:1132 length:522 start_codon:yes stop_codon:yes gene_type:complete